VALALVVASAASADESFEHRGSLGLLLSAGAEVRSAIVAKTQGDNGFRGNLDVGGTWAFTTHWSVIAEARLSLGGPSTGLSLFAGFRNFWGEQIKTFVDLTLAGYALPSFTIGPRVAFGVQYELSPVVGVYALVATSFGGGAGLRFCAEAMAGAQFRTYLFE
jgi:hypothetical protein